MRKEKLFATLAVLVIVAGTAISLSWRRYDANFPAVQSTKLLEQNDN